MSDRDPLEDLLKDPKFVKSIRDLCPKDDGMSVTISVPRTGQSVTLTSDTRKKANARLRRLKEGTR